jgi:hypothetical protein
MLHTSLAAFTDVLSSVIAFRNVGGIIGKKGDGVKGEMPGRSGEAIFEPRRNGYHLTTLITSLRKSFVRVGSPLFPPETIVCYHKKDWVSLFTFSIGD